MFITRCSLQLANCFCHPGKIFIFKVNGLMIAQNDAANEVCVVDAVVFVLFPFSLQGFPLVTGSFEI